MQNNKADFDDKWKPYCIETQHESVYHNLEVPWSVQTTEPAHFVMTTSWQLRVSWNCF